MKRSGGQHTGGWWPVAGTPEVGETARETAERELFEETGLVSDNWQGFGIEIPHADPGKSLETFVVFVPDDAKIELNYEHSDYRWLTGEEAINEVPGHSSVYLQHLFDHFINAD